MPVETTQRRDAAARPWFRARSASALLGSIAVFALGSGAHAGEFFTLKGHGGPIMDITVSRESGRVASASFDNSVGLWSGRTPVWLEGHDAAVNVAEFIDGNRLASGGDDFSVLVWDGTNGTPARLKGHTGKVMELAVSPDKALLASASWDGTIGLWPLAGGEPEFLTGHRAGVSAVAFSPDGRTLYSGSVDGTVRIWDIGSRTEKRVLVRNGFGINTIVLGGGTDNAAAGWLAYGAVDGVTRIVDLKTGEPISDFTLDRRPILALARDRTGTRLATGDGHGFITIIDTQEWRIEHDFRATLDGPIWALDFSRDGGTILAGGIASIVYGWPVDDLAEFDPLAGSDPAFLRDPAEMENGERQFARKCSICHALTADGGRRAGPTLFQVFGRKAGARQDYQYSRTLDESDLVWTEETIDRLFEIGPDHFIPGSKMPMQQITGAGDRKDLVDFLKEMTQ
ncbi:MAG: cytochrome C [Roseitalea sp.]|jgi:cytochrome c|nr:cytochrome C [Roseitalea sp.]MBO6722090.1 cytochrome C [Roseitalea sp.]MBO6741710.1 cytochrome C [Roseitalea sp.]